MKRIILYKYFITLITIVFTFYAHTYSYATTSAYNNYYEYEDLDHENLSREYNNQQSSLELIRDPFEPMNRIIFDFNMTIDTLILEPTINLYRLAIPEPGRMHINYFYKNLGTPIIFINDIFQGNIKKANVSLWRFIINSLIGFGGIIDIATDFGLPYHSGDFSQTLTVWGVPSGPYIMLPLLGPTTTSGIIGKAADLYIIPKKIYSPINSNKLRYLKFLNLRSSKYSVIKNIKENSLDSYTTTKSLYTQYRMNQINK